MPIYILFSFRTSLNKLNTFVLELRVFVLNNFKAIKWLFFFLRHSSHSYNKARNPTIANRNRQSVSIWTYPRDLSFSWSSNSVLICLIYCSRARTNFKSIKNEYTRILYNNGRRNETKNQRIIMTNLSWENFPGNFGHSIPRRRCVRPMVVLYFFFF